MNKHLHLFFTLLFFIYLHTSLNAQTGKWQEGFARADGFTVVNGVEIQFQQVNCNGNASLFLKLINNNNYTVELSWEDAVLNSNNDWVKNKNTFLKSVTLNPNEKLEGSCESKLSQLKLNLADFSAANNFKYFKAAQLNINPISK